MKKKIIVLLTMLLIIFSTEYVAAAEYTETVEVHEYKVTPKADKIDYVYKIHDGKLYKRLYNFSKGEWLGNWILCK